MKAAIKMLYIFVTAMSDSLKELYKWYIVARRVRRPVDDDADNNEDVRSSHLLASMSSTGAGDSSLQEIWDMMDTDPSPQHTARTPSKQTVSLSATWRVFAKTL